jgi:hypothetical protein
MMYLVSFELRLAVSVGTGKSLYEDGGGASVRCGYVVAFRTM